MKTFLAIILIFLIPAVTAVSQEGYVNSCTVTYVANEGFLISTKNHKVLIDALFGGIKGNWCDQPADSVSRLIQNGLAPFGKIDAVLITHKHADHFKAEMVIDFLKNNITSVVICPSQVNQLLKQSPGYPEVSPRIKPFNSTYCPDSLFFINNMKISAMRFNHGSYFITDSSSGIQTDIHEDVENFGYLIEADNFTIFHTGDGSSSKKALFESFGFKTKELDIAFMDRTFLGREGQEILNNFINAGSIVLMHIEPARIEYYKSVVRDFPQFVIFSKPLEEKVFSKKE